MPPNLIGMFNKASTSSLRNSGGGGTGSTGSTGGTGGTGASGASNPLAAPTVDHLTTRIHVLETRVGELSRQHNDQVSENNRLSDEIRRLEQAKADHQIRHAMRVSDLEHRLMMMKQQVWVATNPEAEATAAEGSPPSSSPSSSSRPSLSISTSALPGRTYGPAWSPQSRASLAAERTRRTELESQVASLRTQLNDERRLQSTRDKKQLMQTALLTDRVAAKDMSIAARDTELRRLTALLADQSNISLQRTSRLEQQVAEEAARRQQEADGHAAQLAAQVRAVEELRLQENTQSSQRAAAERQVQRLRDEVARRGAQLEYYQQRLLRTAEFRLVKTPFEAGEAVPTATVPAAPAPEVPTEAAPTAPTASIAMTPVEVAA